MRSIFPRKLLAELKGFTAYDPDYLPSEIARMEAVLRRHPGLPQVACFDTAFHRTMPPVPRTFPSRGSMRQKAWSGTVSMVCLTPS